MDSIGAFLNEEWESLNKMFSNEDHCNFVGHFDVVDLFQCDQNVPGVDESLFFPSNTNDSNLYCISQESGESGEFNTPLFTNQSADTFESMDFIKMDCSNVSVFPDEMMEEILQLKADICNDQVNNAKTHPTETDDSSKAMQLKRKYETQIQGNDEDKSSENPKKKPRAPRNAQKNKKNVQPRKSKAKQVSNKEEEKSGTCSSEEDSNDSESKDATNSKGKGRATRGAATDPQSLYARRRREKINERLRILQNLVPNGTKVDISTMLEEAVQYVKFLQIQIKLLSSDDMWMYAPIAYNGMDLGLYQKMIFPNLWLQN